MVFPLECPECKASMDAGEIPEDIRQHYPPPYHFYRWIGQYDLSKDRTTHYLCPDCGYELK